MPLPTEKIVPGTECLFTGALNVSASGLAGTGRHFTRTKVEITRVVPGYPYPVLLGNGLVNQLGWVHPDDLDELEH